MKWPVEGPVEGQVSLLKSKYCVLRWFACMVWFQDVSASPVILRGECVGDWLRCRGKSRVKTETGVLFIERGVCE